MHMHNDKDRLTFEHPIDRLKLYGLDPANCDTAISQDLFLAEGSTVTPYMPALGRVEVERKDRVEWLEDGRCKYFFKLTHKVNEFWQLFFGEHCGHVDVTFDGDVMVLRCAPEDLQQKYGEICNCAIDLATNDYREERRRLVWKVFENMKEQETHDRTEAEVLAEMETYRQKRREREVVAQENGWSVPFVIQNLNERHRGVLENKFTRWGRILDCVTIRKYKALFELELLVV